MKVTLDLSEEDYPQLKFIKKTDLKEFANQVFDIGYKLKFPNIEINNDILSNNVIISDNENNKILEKYNKLDEMYEKLYGLSMSSNKKGEISEKFIETLIKNTNSLT